MEKRSLKIGTYDTAAHGWTLAGLHIGDALPKTHYVEKPGGDGDWDLSTVLTDGIPRYNNRTLTASLECSKGDRAARERLINEMLNDLDGLEWPLITPDRPEHYLHGRVQIRVEYSDLAHAAVTVTATCGPWLYSRREAVVELTALPEEQTEYLYNRGRRAVVPVLTVSGNARLEYGGNSVELEAGSYEWPALLLTRGRHKLNYSGDGSIKITYREAVLR